VAEVNWWLWRGRQPAEPEEAAGLA
jgi:hypothetical protein